MLVVSPEEFVVLRAEAAAALAATDFRSSLPGVRTFAPASVTDQMVVLADVEGWGFQGQLVTLRPSAVVPPMEGELV